MKRVLITDKLYNRIMEELASNESYRGCDDTLHIDEATTGTSVLLEQSWDEAFDLDECDGEEHASN